MMAARHIGIGVERDWREVYERFWRPEAFPDWAAGLTDASLREVDGEWRANGPGGAVTIRFTPHNAFGVMDHWVVLENGATVHVPLRVFPDGNGAVVVLTLYRQPDMDDAMYERDAKMVASDLARLKMLAER